MSVLYVIRCNGCGTTHPVTGETSLDNARRLARSIGWSRPRRGEDYCKSCSEARAKRAKEENTNGYY